MDVTAGSKTRKLILLRLWRYINHVLTYVLCVMFFCRLCWIWTLQAW